MSKPKESKALRDVWKWKKQVAKETSLLSGDALLNYFNQPAKGKIRKAA